MLVPSPGWLSASMRPPWASAMVCAIERPRPLPGSSTPSRACLTIHEGSHIISEAMTTIAR
jgi:hypothetical protein